MLANTQHITPLVGFNTEQDSGIGYGFLYNYELIEGIDIEAIYLKSSTLKAASEIGDLEGEFDSLLLGVNASRKYNDDLTFKLGGGLGYVFNSNNESLVTDKKMSPYLKFTFNYRTSKTTSIEFGQISQKVEGELSASHTFFAGFNWTFGRKSAINNQNLHPSPTTKKVVITPPASAVHDEALKPEPTAELVPETISALTIVPTPWYIQLGAFKVNNNAKAVLAKYQKVLPQLKLTIIDTPPLHRIISYGFVDKTSALALQQEIQTSTTVKSYLVYIADALN